MTGAVDLRVGRIYGVDWLFSESTLYYGPVEPYYLNNGPSGGCGDMF